MFLFCIPMVFTRIVYISTKFVRNRRIEGNDTEFQRLLSEACDAKHWLSAIKLATYLMTPGRHRIDWMGQPKCAGKANALFVFIDAKHWLSAIKLATYLMTPGRHWIDWARQPKCSGKAKALFVFISGSFSIECVNKSWQLI